MFIDKLLNEGNIPLLEQNLRFTSKRAALLTENGVNLSTPGYKQKDISIDAFQRQLGERVEQRAEGRGADFSDIDVPIQTSGRGILFHDGNNRTPEQLMSDQAQNGMFHNMMIELLRKQFSQIHDALKERVG